MSDPGLDDIVVLGARMTFMVATTAAGRIKVLGERPHCAMWTLFPDADRCVAEMSLTNEGDGENFTEQCTREVGHEGPHVVHAVPGLPILAWLLDPKASDE